MKWILGVGGCAAAVSLQAAERPNIVIIYTDDKVIDWYFTKRKVRE